MAKKVKLPLDMGNDVFVRTLDELKENYNSEKAVESFLDGRLLTWLDDRYYEDEAARVRELSEQGDRDKLAVKLGEIFGVKVETEVDVDVLEIRREKLEKLRKITSDDNILANADSAAFSQEDLGDLLDEGAEVIYLCGGSFRIPLSVENVRYIGVNSPVITIKCRGTIDLSEKGIAIERCTFDEGTKAKLTDSRCDAKLVKKEAPAKASEDVTEMDLNPTVYENVTDVVKVDASAPVTEETNVPNEDIDDDEIYEDEIYDDDDEEEYSDDDIYEDEDEDNSENNVGEGIWYSFASENSIKTNPSTVSLSGLEGWISSGTFINIKEDLSSPLINKIFNVHNSSVIAHKILENLELRLMVSNNMVCLMTNFYNFTNSSRNKDGVMDAISQQSDITQAFISKTKVLPCNKYTIKALGGGSLYEVSDKSRQPFVISGSDIGEIRIYIPLDKWQEFYDRYITPVIIIPDKNNVSEAVFRKLTYECPRTFLIQVSNVIEHIVVDMHKLISDIRSSSDKFPYEIQMLQIPWKCSDMKINGFYNASMVLP